MLGYTPLSSAPISGSISADAFAASISATATSNATLLVSKPLSSSVSVNATVNVSLSIGAPLQTTQTATANTNVTLAVSKLLTSSQNATANINVTLLLNKQLSSQVSATATVAPNLKLTNNSASSVSATTTVAPNLTLVNNLAASIVGTNILATALNVDKLLQAQLSATATVAPNLKLVNNLAASIVGTNILATALNVDKLLQAQLSTTATVAPNLKLVNNAAASVTTAVSTSSTVALTKNLSSSLSVNATTTSALLVVNNVAAAVSTTATVSPTLKVVINLATNAANTITPAANLTLEHYLQGNLQTDSDIMVGIPVNASVSVQSNVFALLDIDGNTEGSPGGIPVEGFYPPSSVILANHSESAAAATYTITADIEPGYTTEIVQAYTDINPNNVIQLSYANNIVSVYLNTPLEVYGMSSTFTVSRDVVPQFDVAFNYNLQLNTTVTNSSNGNNFRSNKFYIYGNESPCFLRDDGAGFITLFEEPEPGLIRKLRDTGKIDYVKGELSVESLRITGLVDAFLQFSATSLNTIVPTTDYFNEKNSLLVQAKTVAFPTGEAVEIYQYTKAEELIDVYITVVARAYNPLAPEITVDQREAVYKLTVLPDYNLGKDKLQQLLQAA